MLNIIATSIGTVSDTSLRAAHTMAQCQLLLVEDTRTFGTYYQSLLDLYHLTPVTQTIQSYHTQNEFEKLPLVLAELEAGSSVALISEAGMPLVSDPGRLLVEKAVERGFSYTVIPGPSALTTAMVHAFSPHPTLFIGFMPKKNSQRTALFESLATSPLRPLSVCAYESPHRVHETLETLHNILPESTVTLCRELSKKFETIHRGKPNELLGEAYKGEITLVVEVL